MMDISMQLYYLFLLPIPIACISWTFTQEDIFRQAREYFVQQSKRKGSLVRRKFFYMLTCEYCFSHYVALAIIMIANYKLLLDGWTGFVIAWFSLVWIANIYMSLYALLRQGLKHKKMENKIIEEENDL